jgi:hypothetical protein
LTATTTGIEISRIENTFTDEHGDDVKLKKGAHVEVTVTAEPKTPTAATNEDDT